MGLFDFLFGSKKSSEADQKNEIRLSKIVDNVMREDFMSAEQFREISEISSLMGDEFLNSPSYKRLKPFMDRKYQQSLKSDHFSWGGWKYDIHNQTDQERRQERASEFDEDNATVDYENQTAIVNGYNVTLSSCSCKDFQERRLPCKHIYYLALELDLPV